MFSFSFLSFSGVCRVCFFFFFCRFSVWLCSCCWCFFWSLVCVSLWLWSPGVCLPVCFLGVSVCVCAVRLVLGVSGRVCPVPWFRGCGRSVGGVPSRVSSCCSSCWSFPSPVLVRLCSCPGSCPCLGRRFGWLLVSCCVLPPWPWVCPVSACWLLLAAPLRRVLSGSSFGCGSCWCSSVWLHCRSFSALLLLLPLGSLGPCPAGPGLVVSALVGFSGSRSLPARFGGLAAELAGSVLAAGRGVAVGCAPGLDAMVRSACPSAVVFRVAGSRRGDFAARSVACVREVAGSGVGAGWVSFPGCPCPESLAPSPCSSLCFCGSGSGSWASAALAAGLGLPVVVFGLPSSSLPASWGSWSRAASSGPWSQGFRLSPRAQQLSLFS
jgi:hypothetical protein